MQLTNTNKAVAAFGLAAVLTVVAVGSVVGGGRHGDIERRAVDRSDTAVERRDDRQDRRDDRQEGRGDRRDDRQERRDERQPGDSSPSVPGDTSTTTPSTTEPNPN